MRPLSLLEARVLGVLVEKAATVPDSYPLSLNALVLGCNQKSARDPVLSAGEGEVQLALDGLRQLSLAFESSGSRVSRYEHNLGRALGVPSQSVALLAVLMLRGPQTSSELRANSERLHRFADISAVEAFLRELAQRPDGALVAELPRQPGTRETRYTHLLSGVPIVAEQSTANVGEEHGIAVSEVSAIKRNIGELREEIERLKTVVARLCNELGLKE